MMNYKESKISVAVGTLLLICLLANPAASSAPSDAHQRCIQSADRPIYEEGEKVLMDSRHYEYLIGQSEAVWDRADFDTNNNGNSFTYQTEWRPSTGGICKWSIQSCGFSVGKQDNWVFTQYIEKDAPGSTNYDVEICVNVTHRIINCRVRNRCNPEFEVYKYTTSAPQSQTQVKDKNNYERIIFRRQEKSKTINEHQCFIMRQQERGFYLALRDPNSCVTVSRLVAYRHECKAQQVGLALFPRLASATQGNKRINGQCVANAEPVTSLGVQCRSDGVWIGSPRCQCKAGFRQEKNREGNMVCTACPAGTFRSATDTQTTCLPCPPNTARDQTGASECKCFTNYYRNTAGIRGACPQGQTAEGPHTGCTQPSSEPTSISTSGITSNSLTLRWGAPSNLGGRTDLYYSVEYSDPANIGQYIKASGNTCVRARSFQVSGLKPATNYVVRVVARNGVSDEEDGMTRVISTTVTTAHAAPSAPQSVQGFCSVVVWGEPQSPNGVLTGYDIIFYRPGNFRSATSKHLQSVKNFYITTGSFSQDTLVQVRAVNDAGAGSWSSAVSIGCSNGCPSGLTPPTNSPSPPPSPTPDITAPGAVSVSNITVLGCGIVSWKPPADTGGEMPGYAIRFFDGQTYETSQYRDIQRHFGDPNRRWAVAANLPSGRIVYVDIRAKNSAGASQYSSKVVAADSTICAHRSAVCPVITPVTCPPKVACDSCCAACPTVKPCPAAPTNAGTSGVTATSLPGTVHNVRVLNCTTIVWDAPENDGGQIDEYRIRLYNGANFWSSRDRLVISSVEKWTIPTKLPAHPFKLVVKARNSQGFSALWSQEISFPRQCSCSS